MAIELKAIEYYFQVVLFIMLYKAVLTFMSVDETVACDHLKESYRTVLSCGTVCHAVQVCSKHSNESYQTVLSCGTVCYAVQGCSVD